MSRTKRNKAKKHFVKGVENLKVNHQKDIDRIMREELGVENACKGCTHHRFQNLHGKNLWNFCEQDQKMMGHILKGVPFKKDSAGRKRKRKCFQGEANVS